MIDDIVNKCKELRLKTCGENIEDVVAFGSKENWPSLKVIGHLFDLEIEGRRKSRIELRFRQSRLFRKPTIDQFDFNHHSSRKKQKNKILNLLTCEFIQQKMDII